MWKFSLFFIVALLFIPTSGCYAKGPWRGKVIDAETKQPIEGAAVVAVWETWTSTPAGTSDNYLDAEEALTNKDGEFEIPSKVFLSIIGIRQVKGPFFTIYKPGYGSYPEHQTNVRAPHLTASEYFQTQGAVVELPKLNLKTREERLKYLPNTPYGMFGHEDKMKYFKRLLDQEIKSINSIDSK